jgi:hypothetical protein
VRDERRKRGREGEKNGATHVEHVKHRVNLTRIKVIAINKRWPRTRRGGVEDLVIQDAGAYFCNNKGVQDKRNEKTKRAKSKAERCPHLRAETLQNVAAGHG